MNREQILSPVSAEDHCGPDLRWDPDFTSAMAAYEATTAEALPVVVGGETASAPGGSADTVITDLERLLARSKDVRLLAMRAELMWHRDGLTGFEAALEDTVQALEIWPEPDTGIHPRADEQDPNDRMERAASLGKLMNHVATLAATIGWGRTEDADEQGRTAKALKKLFSEIGDRSKPALGADSPSTRDAWTGLQKLVGGVLEEGAEANEQPLDGAQTPGAAPGAGRRASANAWETLERAAELMQEQSPHSPTVPLMKVMLTWRELDLIEVARRMKAAGTALDTLLETLGKYDKQG